MALGYYQCLTTKVTNFFIKGFLAFNHFQFDAHSQYCNCSKAPEINSEDRMEADASH